MTEIKIYPDKDAYIDSIFHSTNFGDSTKLGIQRRLNETDWIKAILAADRIKHYEDGIEEKLFPYIEGSRIELKKEDVGDPYATSTVIDYDSETSIITMADSISGMDVDDRIVIYCGHEKMPFIHFPFEEIPIAVEINSALLNIYISDEQDISPDNSIQLSYISFVHGYPDYWDEDTLTWDDIIERLSGGSVKEGGDPVCFDTKPVGWITRSIKDWLSQWYHYQEFIPNHGFYMWHVGSNLLEPAYYYSRETEEHKPYVTVDYTLPGIIGKSYIID